MLLNFSIRLICFSVVFIISPMVHAFPFVVFDPRSAAMGGATVALDSRYGAVHNIALSGRAEEFVDWYVALPSVGYQESDHVGFENDLADFQSAPDTGGFNKLLGRTITDQDLAALVVTVPSDILGGGFYLARTQLTGARIVSAGAGDAAGYGYLEKRGIKLTEHGIGFAQYKKPEFFFLQDAIIGISAKLIAAQTIYSREDVSVAETDIGFRGDEVLAHSAFNMDIGLLKELTRFSATALTLRNVLPMDFRYGNDSGKHIVMNPLLRFGWAYQRSDRALALDLDLTSNPDVAFHGRSRYLALGGELGFWDHLFLRGGVRFNFLGDQEIMFTTGAGLDFGGNRLDAAWFTSEDQSGAMAHLNIRF